MNVSGFSIKQSASATASSKSVPTQTSTHLRSRQSSNTTKRSVAGRHKGIGRSAAVEGRLPQSGTPRRSPRRVVCGTSTPIGRLAQFHPRRAGTRRRKGMPVISAWEAAAGAASRDASSRLRCRS